MSDINDKPVGAFFANLNRSNKNIKQDRAIAIQESAQMLYKRAVEDMEMQLKQLQRDRVNALDLSPTNTDSLVLASNFDGADFVRTDIDLGLKIRNLQIKLDIAKDSYKYLFEDAQPVTE